MSKLHVTLGVRKISQWLRLSAFDCTPCVQRRGSQRNLTLQPQAAGGIKMMTDFPSATDKAKQLDARRAANHGLPKQAVMAPF